MIFNKKSKKMKKKLDSILNTTYELVKNSDIKDVRRCPAYSLVRAMTNYHLFDIVRELYEDENVTKVQSIFRDIGEGIFNSRVLENAECFELGKSNINIDLSKDAILVCAWNKRRFIDALLKIGGNVNNSFEFDKINHMATYIYPIGVTVVYNGNHSIITGILKSEGMIQAKICGTVNAYCDVFKPLMQGQRILVCISIIGCKGVSSTSEEEGFFTFYTSTIDRNMLMCNPIVLEDIDSDDA